MPTSTPESDERASAGENLVVELVRAFKVRRLYDAGHPQRRDSEDASATRIAAILEAGGPVDFTVESSRLLVDDRTVFEQVEGRESLAYLLHREGLRQLSFYPGLTGEELGVLLDEVAAASLAGPDDAFDLVARLWESNFVHIRYTFVEHLMDEEWMPAPSEAEDSLVIGRDDQAVVIYEEDKTATDYLRDADPALYFLDDEDMALLQRDLESEKERSLLPECLTCLRELLLNPEIVDPTATIGAVADVQSAYYAEGSYREIVALHELFAPYLESDQVDDERRAAFRKIRDRTLELETLLLMAARLDAGTLDDAVAAEYYGAFGSDQLGLLLAHCGDVKRLCQRPSIAEAFVALARQETTQMRDAILSDDPLVAIPASYLAGLASHQLLLEALARALKSTDSLVRREALTAIKQIGGPRSLEIVAGAVQDEDPTVRLYALRHLVTHRYASALPRVTALLERPGGRSITERRLLYEAYGALGGDSVIDDLGKRLQRKGLFRKADPEEMACVLVALGATGTAEARGLVEEATTAKHPLVQRTAVEVLQSWDSRQGARR